MGSQQSVSIQPISFPHLELSIKQQTLLPKQNSMVEAITFSKNKTQITRQQRKFIFDCCKSYSFFSHLSENKILQLSKKFLISFCSEQWIFKEGSIASFFFIVSEGYLQVIKKGQFVRKLGPQDCFGQMALLHGIKRSSSIRIVKQSRTKNVFFVLSKNDFLQAIKHFNLAKNCQFLSIVSKNIPFSYLTSRQKFQLAQESIKLNFKAGDRIISKFDEPFSLFLLKSGKIKLNFPQQKQLDIGEGHFFGYSGSNDIQCSATSIEQASTYAIGKDYVNKILSGNIKFIHLWNKVKYALINCNKLKSLSMQRVQEITALFQFKFIIKQQAICLCHSNIKKIYILINCSQNLQVIGIQQLFNGEKKYLFDVISTKSGHYAEIDADLLMKFVQNDNLTVSDRYLKGFSSSNSQNLAILPKKQQKTQVFLYKQKRFNLYYLLQIADKSYQKNVQYLKNKAEILKSVNSKLIQGIYFLEQEERYIILAKQYIRGTSIKQNILNIGMIPYSICRFYIACIVAIIQCLHNNNIVCPNLSIDQFKIDEAGYLCLSQFEAEFLNKQQNEKKQINSDIFQDYKRVGLIAYELLIGYPLLNPLLNSRNINIQYLNFPLNFKRRESKDLIQNLLLCQKIGSNGWLKVKEMSFFQGIDWKALIRKQIQAPIIPGFMISNPLIF